MALHSRWSSGDLIFYDGTQDIFRIKNGTGGIVVGKDDEGVDLKFYGETTGAYFHFDESGDLIDFHNIKITNQAPTTVATTGGITTIELEETDNRFQFIDTTGANNILLPSATGATAIGIQYFIANTSTGANTLSVYDDTSGGTLVAQIAQNNTGILVNDGNIWRGIVAETTA